jgi:hypothetical protein
MKKGVSGHLNPDKGQEVSGKGMMGIITGLYI